MDGTLIGTTSPSTVDLGVMEMKGYSTLSKSLAMEPLLQNATSCHTPDTLFILINFELVLQFFN